MADLFDVQVPGLGESVSEATIAKWAKSDGDYVAADDVIAELETDKASVEMPAGKAGTLKIVTPKGATVAVGAVIAKIDLSGKSSGGGKAEAAAAAAPAASAGGGGKSGGGNVVDLKATGLD